MGQSVLLLLVVSITLGVQLRTAEGYWSSGCAFNRTHNYMFGRRSYQDRLLYTNQTFVRSSFWGRNTLDVDFPERGRYPRGTITYIEAFDQRRDGGCAELRRGGPGFNFARIRLVSGWNDSLNFLINVFGH